MKSVSVKQAFAAKILNLHWMTSCCKGIFPSVVALVVVKGCGKMLVQNILA
jgi:hypothetical protein